MPFKVGDKVRVTHEAGLRPSDEIGIVMEVNSNSIGLFYKGWYQGHSLAGKLSGRNVKSGWYLPPRALVLVESEVNFKEKAKEDSPLIKKIKYLEHKFKTRHNPVEKKEEEWYDF
jgi:hypothetical protein